MSLYPSLEDMQVDKILQSQNTAVADASAAQQRQQLAYQDAPPAYTMNPYPEIHNINVSPITTSGEKARKSADFSYPDLADYLGLELSQEVIAANMPEYLNRDKRVAYQQLDASPVTVVNNTTMVAPISGSSVGLQRGQVTNGIRELILCKGSDKKVGLRAQSINKGVFVCLVVRNSPAAIAGLRFGDQILQINGTLVAGYSVDDVHKLLKKSDKNNISLVVRDRPFERAVILHKDSTGHVGFQFNDGKITAIVKDSSAARNGLLIDHQILEVNGQNVIAMKDKEISNIITNGGNIITLTIIPSMIYDVIMKKLSSSFIRGKMDHSIPDF
ncbi:syntenin-1-like [Toxorhynchites rutilus septentrionalis]|uniref:syntenin-1-like n=1 Tax=Toxorhynchites rutilus septentrionalis TaxID=329112 RepID=UPI00247A88CA|nr:syntenin-1-like [Toxorhynchites rutilus septentrionalis]XP_055632340.1 syntenin-1-like [Toxorhynchites rutilus septentrionalis]